MLRFSMLFGAKGPPITRGERQCSVFGSVLGTFERVCSVFHAIFMPFSYPKVDGFDRLKWVGMLRFRQYGVINVDGTEIVPFGKYEWIDGFDSGLARIRIGKGPCNINSNTVFGYWDTIDEKNKWGIINEKGEEVLPIEYDSIWNFAGKNRYSTRVVKDGVNSEVYLHDLNPTLPVCGKSKRSVKDNVYDSDNDDYGTHYGEFAGTYAQDVAGFSDDVINDAFDGDPDAYWNID